MSAATYTIKIDWDNDGSFATAGDDITSEVRKVSFWRGRPTEMETAAPGGCRIILKDTTGKYVPENTGSSLSGKLLPARSVQIATTFLGTPYTLFTGYIDDIIPEPDQNSQKATIVCVDGFDQLKRVRISMSVQADIYSGIAGGAGTGIIYQALDNAGWPAAKRTLDGGTETYPLVYAEKERCLDFLQQIEKSEFGFMYIDGDGYFNWEDRHYRLTNTRCIVSNWIATAALYRKLVPLQPLKGIINKASLTAYPKTKSGVVNTIWVLQDTGADSPLIGSGVSQTFVAHFIDGDATSVTYGQANIADDVVTPTIAGADDDYHAFSDTAEAGTDLSVFCSITALVDDTNLFADRAYITVTNTGTQSFYLTKLMLRGKIYHDEGKLEILSEDATSQTAYLIREYESSLPFYQHSSVMQGVADNIVYTYKNPMPRYEMELANASDAILTQILARKLSDRITLQNAGLNINDDFFIEQMNHEISEGGKLHRCWWTLSKVDSRMFWILDTSRLCLAAASEYAFPTVAGY